MWTSVTLSFLHVACIPLHFSHCRDSWQFFNQLSHGSFKSFISLNSVGDLKDFIPAITKEPDVHPVETEPCDEHWQPTFTTLTRLSLFKRATHTAHSLPLSVPPLFTLRGSTVISMQLNFANFWNLLCICVHFIFVFLFWIVFILRDFYTLGFLSSERM